MRRFVVLAAILAVLVGCALETPDFVLAGTLHGNPPVLLIDRIHHRRSNPTPWWDHIRIWFALVFPF